MEFKEKTQNQEVNPTGKRGKKGKLVRLCLLTLMVGSVMLSACKKEEGEPDVGINPKWPKPAWGPSIKPQMQRVIEKLDELSGGVPLQTLTPEQARMAPSAADAVKGVMQEYGIGMPPSGVDTVGVTIPVEGGSIHGRVYTPKNTAGPLPGIVYYHGGGWVIATIDTYDASARALCEQSGAVVVSIEYSKGPEFKYPTAHNDSFAAYGWVLANATTLKINPAKVAVAGESAGGNLAAAVSMMARDSGIAIPVHQLLVYPIANYDVNSPSYMEYAEAKPLSKPLMEWFFGHYLSTPAEGNSPLISLVKATNLTGLPPATVINAQIDPLLSEGQQYGENLKGAGIAVTSKIYEGVTHEFFGMASIVPQAKDAQKLAADELKKAFAR